MGARAVYRLIYVSRADKGLSDSDIADILNTSQSNNYERFITGLLVHSRGQFLQVLEGDESEVMGTYGRILRDNRHHCVTQIAGRRGVSRMFPEWAMNYRRVDISDRVEPHSGPICDLFPETVRPEMAALLQDFAEIQ